MIGAGVFVTVMKGKMNFSRFMESPGAERLKTHFFGIYG